MRIPRLLVAVAVASSASCLSASNPCDPNASPELQAEGTRIGGRVLDQTGAGISGVTVTLLGLSKTAVSGSDGGWAIDDVPPSTEGYVVRAEPAAPLSGGTRTVGALGCQQKIDDADVVVIAPLDAPEVEIVRAVSPTSLLVAFGSGDSPDAEAPGDDDELSGLYQNDARDRFRDASDVAATCDALADAADRSWRVQVRPPFDTWHDAVLNGFPWLDGNAAVDINIEAPPGAALASGVLYSERTDDFCAAALCAQFAYLEPTLQDPRARCANVVGFIDDGDVKSLEAFGTYEVRVLTEVRVEPALAAQFALPARVTSAAPSAGLQMSLVPGSLLPLVDGFGQPLDGRGLEITTVVTTSGGRFALVEPDGLTVLGSGGDVFGDAPRDLAAGAPQNALAEDGGVDVAADFNDDGDTEVQALAALPAGDWLRVVKDATTNARIEKVFIGASAVSGNAGPPPGEANLADAAEATLPLSPSGSALGELRAISYLDPGTVRLDDAAANPDDAYLMLYRRGFVLVENGVRDNLQLQSFVETADVANPGAFIGDWADPAAGFGNGQRLNAFGGDCADVEPSGGDATAFAPRGAEDDLNGSARSEVAVCYDVQNAAGGAVNLKDSDVLVVEGGEPLHVMADAQNDRILAVGLDALRGNRGPLAANINDVPVGRTPVALTHSVILDCEGGQREEVILVANAGSADVSVLRANGEGVAEAEVVALPTPPTGFLDDVAGPSCENPFAWVIASDGRLFPIDMRGSPSVPLCGGEPCEISSRGRARSGAVGGGAAVSRALVGGVGLLGELGFFRPAALLGGGFLDSDGVADGVENGTRD